MGRGRPAAPGLAKKTRAPSGAAAVVVLPESPLAPFTPPAELPEGAVAIWERIVDELVPRGLRPADVEMVRMLVLAAWRNREAEELVARHGLLVAGRNGPVANPAVQIARSTRNDYVRLAQEMGLTVAARLRLGLMQLAGESILAGISRDLDQRA